jgi:signal transduction histidine kinase
MVGRTTILKVAGHCEGSYPQRHRRHGVGIRPVRLIAAIGFALEALIVCSIGSAAQPLPRSVLILNQSTPFGPWQNTIIAAIRSTMNEGAAEPVTFYLEHLDFSRFKGQQYLSSLENHFREKYRDKPIGVMVAIGPVALDYALNIRTVFLPSVPIVFTAVEDTHVTQGSIPSNVTGVTMDQSLSRMIEAAQIVVPDLKGFAIVGTRLEDQIYYRNFANDLPNFSRVLQFIDLMGLSVDETRERVSALPEHTAILYIGLNFYGSAAYVAAEVVPLIAERANRPIIVDAETFLGTGAVGGFILTPRQLGQDAGRLALSILQGADVSGIPITRGSPRKPIFDWRQLQRWQVDAGRLPIGSEIRFRERGIWDQYWGYILSVVAAILLQGALISWLLYEHWRRTVAEANSMELTHELTQMNRFATAGEMSASIAHELRQPLAAIASYGSAGLNWLKKQVPDLNEARVSLEAVVRESHRADDVIKSVRAIFRHESPARAQINLNELIQDVITVTARSINSNNIVLNTNLTDNPPPVVMANSVQLKQVILNLIMNAVDAMSQPGHWARILQLGTQVLPDGTVLMRVTDSGPSADPKIVAKMFQPFFTTKPGGMGMGLPICKTIVEAHGGTLTASPSKPHGMEFRIVLPLANMG